MINEKLLKDKMSYLFEGSATSGNVTLNDSIENYDFVLVGIQAGSFSKNCMIIPVDNVVYTSASNHVYDVSVFQTSSVYASMNFSFSNATTILIKATKVAGWNSANLIYVIGIKI